MGVLHVWGYHRRIRAEANQLLDQFENAIFLDFAKNPRLALSRVAGRFVGLSKSKLAVVQVNARLNTHHVEQFMRITAKAGNKTARQ